MGTNAVVGAIRITREIVVVDKEEFDKMWTKAMPSQRYSELSLPVMGVLKDGVYYVPFGALQFKGKPIAIAEEK